MCGFSSGSPSEQIAQTVTHLPVQGMSTSAHVEVSLPLGLSGCFYFKSMEMAKLGQHWSVFTGIGSGDRMSGCC